MSFDSRIQDLRRYLDFEDALSVKTEELIAAVVKEHVKSLPKKRAAPKRTKEEQHFKVTITERGQTTESVFSSEKDLDKFLTVKHKSRVSEINSKMGKPYPTHDSREYSAGQLERRDKINETFQEINIKIEKL